MGLLSNLFGRGGEKTYRWKPLRCMPGDIVDLMRECERIDAPIVSLEVELDGVRQRVGMSSDYERDRGFFDTVWYVDDEGNTREKETTYENGLVTFVTDHFSYYSIHSEFAPEDVPSGGDTPSGTDEPDGGSGGGSNAILFAGIAVAVIAVIGAAFLFLRRR